MLIDICMKFREYSLSGFQVIERTRFVTDRQTDGQTDGKTDGKTDARGKTICLPTLKTTISGPSSAPDEKRHLNDVSLECRVWPYINCSFVIFRDLDQLLKKLCFCDILEGLLRTPSSPIWIRAWRGRGARPDIIMSGLIWFKLFE